MLHPLLARGVPHCKFIPMCHLEWLQFPVARHQEQAVIRASHLLASGHSHRIMRIQQTGDSRVLVDAS